MKKEYNDLNCKERISICKASCLVKIDKQACNLRSEPHLEKVGRQKRS